MGAQVTSEIYAIKHGRQHYHLARNNFLPQAFGIACPISAPYVPTVNLL